MSSDGQPHSTTSRSAPSPVRPLNVPVVAAIAVLAILVVAVTVIGAQAWILSGDARQRQAYETAAAANAPQPAVFTEARFPEARQNLIAQHGLPGWATTQPATPQGPVAATSSVPGLNRVKVKAGVAAFGRLGCAACHTTDGRAGVGPSLFNIFGADVELAGGTSIKVDAAYIRESIRKPTAKVHNGYPPVMPDFGPQIKDREIDTITEFLRSISPDPINRKETGPAPAATSP